VRTKLYLQSNKLQPSSEGYSQSLIDGKRQRENTYTSLTSTEKRKPQNKETMIELFFSRRKKKKKKKETKNQKQEILLVKPILLLALIFYSWMPLSYSRYLHKNLKSEVVKILVISTRAHDIP
jgi:hypothetical protein